MKKSREFPIAVIASLTTGILLCEFSAMHEAAEFIAGGPIFTHHFASKYLTEKLRNKILKQHPDIPVTIEGVTKDNYREHITHLEENLGKTRILEAGDGDIVMHPLEGIPGNKHVIIIQKDGENA